MQIITLKFSEIYEYLSLSAFLSPTHRFQPHRQDKELLFLFLSSGSKGGFSVGFVLAILHPQLQYPVVMPKMTYMVSAIITAIRIFISSLPPCIYR